MPGLLPHVTASLLYGLLAGHFWRTRWRPRPLSEAPRSEASDLARWVILLPLGLHAWLLQQALFGGGGLDLGLGNAVSLIALLTVSLYWSANLLYPLEGLQPLVLALAAAGVLLPALVPGQHPLPNTDLLAFRVHLLMSMLAYSLFTIAALHALLMALLERRLHDHARLALLASMPPLLTMETLLFRILWAAFALLTLTLISGAVFSEELFGRPFQFNHKTVFALVSWGIFAALLGGRAAYGWRGRVAVRWTLAGFVTLLLAYVGTRFVLEFILNR